eukprot:jgi/Psemu1/200694/e_gw1.262.9.1
MGGNNNYRRQLARTCKKFGLLVQPNALPLLIQELESRGGAESEEFLALLGVFRDRLARAPSPKLVSIALVEQVLEDERASSARRYRQKQQQQQQQQQLRAPPNTNTRKKRTKMVLKDESEAGETPSQSQQTDPDPEHDYEYEEQQQQQQQQKQANSRSRSRSSFSSSIPNRGRDVTKKTPKPWKIVSAFETPKLVYDSMRRQFRYDSSSANGAGSSLMGTANDLMDMRIQRYELVKQTVDRHREQHRLSKITTIDRLLGTATATATATTKRSSTQKQNQRTLLGMLRSNPALGCLELEDPTGSLPLAIDRSAGKGKGACTKVDPSGLYLEGTMVLVTGTHEDSESESESESLLRNNAHEDSSGTVFRCASIELPPLEARAETVQRLPPSPLHVEGGSGGGALRTPVPLYALSDLCLDEPECLERVGTVIDRMIYETSGDDDDDDDDEHNGDHNDDENDDSKVGAILVLFGNFCTETLTVSGALDELANLLREKNIPSRHSVLLVPGPGDVGSNACWPLPAWNKRNTPSSLHPFLAAAHEPPGSGSAGGSGIVHLCSNPCRLEFSDGRQVVLVRKDLVRESLRHQVLPADDNNDDNERPFGPLAHRVFHHALSQSHLSPSSSSQQAASASPIYWNYDHAMALLPLPDLIVAGLDAEYLEEGTDYYSTSTSTGCRVVAPVSNPSRNEWQCALAVLGRRANSKIHVEFDNDEDYYDDEADEIDYEPSPRTEQEIYDNYRALGGSQTQTDTQLSQTQLSAY